MGKHTHETIDLFTTSNTSLTKCGKVFTVVFNKVIAAETTFLVEHISDFHHGFGWKTFGAAACATSFELFNERGFLVLINAEGIAGKGTVRYEAIDAANGRTARHVAVISGQGKTVRRILEMPRLVGITNEKDNEGNTALHLAVIYKRDNIIRIIARNREMESAMVNNNRFTAYDIFSRQPRKLCFSVAKIHYLLQGSHGLPALQEWISTNLRREMIGETDEDMNILFSRGKEQETDTSTATHEASDETEKRSRLEIHLLIAMLIATVTFQAAFTMLGGYKQDGPDEGTAQFVHKAAFIVFIIFNTIAFIFSIATVYIQFTTSKFSYNLRSRYACLAEAMIFIAVLGMVLAFASGMYLELATSIGLRLIAYIMVGCFLLIYYACWFVDPISMQIPGLQLPSKYLRDLLFRYGII
ncbi:ankyrin repeat-containing protein NPR4-like [Durio zibethinus]|uniref:Ankyrin repeat-containing protein NPR4-like n=1 Tax=Durio zibethinus TaxID=66656 RepID=A0A6P5YTB3_DURZI|nr:ankyrin repeat-containing protein NPR4-like [Durio zibethinus]